MAPVEFRGERPSWAAVRLVLFDLAPVLIALAGSLILVAGSGAVLRSLHGTTAVVLTVSALSLARRRRNPVSVAAVVAGVAILLPLIEFASPGALIQPAAGAELNLLICWLPAAPFAAYAATAHAGGRWPAVIAVAVMLLAAALVGPALDGALGGLGESSGTASPSAVVIRSLSFVLIGMVLGLYAAARRRLLGGLVERAERAERERHLLAEQADLLAEQARADERSRMAAEMHDVVSHRVSMMVLQAGALTVSHADPAVRKSAEEMRANGYQALQELRAVVGLLGSARGVRPGFTRPAHPANPADSADPSMASLIEESVAVGVMVDLLEEGDPELISPVVRRTAHRVVQEALTNVRKHAPGAEVVIGVRYRSDGLRLGISNSAPTGPADPLLVATGSGRGLAGLRSRVEVIGGTLNAGPDDDGGFTVEGSLPPYVPTRGNPS